MNTKMNTPIRPNGLPVLNDTISLQGNSCPLEITRGTPGQILDVQDQPGTVGRRVWVGLKLGPRDCLRLSVDLMRFGSFFDIC